LIDHTADIGFEVEAPTWAGLLAAATAALADLILPARDPEEDDPAADPDAARSRGGEPASGPRSAGVPAAPAPAWEDVPLEVRGEDREDVLVAWLNAVVVRYEDDGFLAREARVDRAERTRAVGALRGRHLDPRTEPPDRVVKAVTYHGLAVVEGRGARPWRATVILDL
jgi:SHS2 domain-containing protein